MIRLLTTHNSGRGWILNAAFAVTLAGCSAWSGSGLAPGRGEDSAAILATIPVGPGPTMLAMSPNGSHVYAAGNGILNVISTASNSEVDQVLIDPNTVSITITPDGSRALITSLFSIRLTVVDTATNTVIMPIELVAQRVRGGYGRIGLSPDGRVAYLPNDPNALLVIVNLDEHAKTSPLMQIRPRDVALTPNGRTAYVCGCKDFCSEGSVVPFDTTTRRFGDRFAVGPRPYRIAITRDGRRAYTTNLGDASVSVVALPLGTPIARVPVRVEPTGLAISPDGSEIYVTSLKTGDLMVIDGATNAVRASLKVGNAAREVVVTPDGRRAYVSTNTDVVVVDTQALQDNADHPLSGPPRLLEAAPGEENEPQEEMENGEPEI